MTIIFSNHLDDDCKTVATMWQNWNCNVVEILPTTNDYEDMVDKAISEEEDTLILIGHGTTNGLLHPRFNGEYLIHENNIGLIKARRVICCWCYASTFCEKHFMHCFATSMFISNVDEAYNNGICDLNQDQINACSRLFFAELGYLIESHTPMNLWVDFLCERTLPDNHVDEFNRMGLWYNR